MKVKSIEDNILINRTGLSQKADLMNTQQVLAMARQKFSEDMQKLLKEDSDNRSAIPTKIR